MGHIKGQVKGYVFHRQLLIICFLYVYTLLIIYVVDYIYIIFTYIEIVGVLFFSISPVS